MAWHESCLHPTSRRHELSCLIARSRTVWESRHLRRARPALGTARSRGAGRGAGGWAAWGQRRGLGRAGMSDRLALANAIEDAGIERSKAQRVASVIFDAIHATAQ